MPPSSWQVGLVDAVLSDPGVDWAVEREDAAAREDMELAVALGLFVSRWGQGWWLGLLNPNPMGRGWWLGGKAVVGIVLNAPSWVLLQPGSWVVTIVKFQQLERAT